MATEDNISIKEMALPLNVNVSSLCRWMYEYDEYGESAFPSHGNALFVFLP